MRKALIPIILLALISLRAQEVYLTVKVTAASLPENGKVYISGNTENTGGWNPSAVELTSIGDLQWKIILSFNAGESVEFKLTGGSWEKEAVYATGAIPQNFALRVQKDTTLEIFIPFWRNEVAIPRKITGQVTGNVKYHKAMTYENLLPRDVLVWLPPGYDEETGRYPVLYMHDGQNVFDPATSTMGYDWQADEIADSLIRSGLMKKIIIVAIYNTRSRNPEYTQGDTTDVYMRFVAVHLKEFIDKTYRTLPERENTAVAGSSAGGLIAFRLGWDYNEVFSMVAAISPALKIYEIDFVTPVTEYKGVPKKLNLYIDNGGLGLEEKLQPGVDEMLLALEKQGFKQGKDFVWMKFENAVHTESAWAARFHLPLLQFFGINK